MNFSILLSLLFVLACPLMMIFMMRGMHGGHDTTNTDRRDEPAKDVQARIAELEREVAALHGTSVPVRLNKPANKS